MKTLVLDAMGVIYAAGDDVEELLCPFIHEHGGISDDRRIEALYHDASLGCLSAMGFWKQVQLDGKLENTYLMRHHLTTGLLQFLRDVRPRVASIWCLSNDVSEWSRKLRKRFGLDRLIDGFVISGDVRARKPNAAIFEHLLAKVGVGSGNIILIDDRQRNLDAAAALGFQTVLFGSAVRESIQHYATNDFGHLLEYICNNDGV